MKYLSLTLAVFGLLGVIAADSAAAQESAEQTIDYKAHMIVFNGTPEEVKQFLSTGYDVNESLNCRTLLDEAIENVLKVVREFPESIMEKIQIVIDAGADVNAASCPTSLLPLAKAASLPNQGVQRQKQMLELWDNDMNTGGKYCQSYFGPTPCNEVSTLEKKIARASFATVLEKNRLGRAPQYLRTVKILLDNGAIIDKQDAFGQTALHLAAQNPKGESLEPLKYLIERGADINIRDNKGNTPLHIAFASENDDAVDILIKAGADTQIRNNAGKLYNQVARGVPDIRPKGK